MKKISLGMAYWFCFMVMASFPANAETYKCIDERNNISYSDQPCPGNSIEEKTDQGKTRPFSSSPHIIQRSETAALLNTPEYTIREFYNALNRDDCETAEFLRPGYSLERCKQIHNVDVYKVAVLERAEKAVLLEIELEYQENENLKKYSGGVILTKDGNAWKIEHKSYRSDRFKALRLYEQNYKNELSGIKATTTSALKSPRGAPSINSDSISMLPSSFGSKKVLDACWTQDQLQGNFSDKKIKNHYPDPHIQPKRSTSHELLPPLANHLTQSIRSVIPRDGKKLVALTFDLCEQAVETTGYDATIVDYLRENRVKATFFAGGKWMHSHPEKAMQLMADPLFEIGNHSWTHGNLRVLKGQEMVEQITWTQAQYEILREELEARPCANELVDNQEMSKIPPLPYLFRFPYGTCNAQSLHQTAVSGLAAIQWNIVTSDPWRKQTARGIARRVLKEISPGAIIIAHANGRGWHTGEALPLFIPKLRDQDYEFVTVSELLQSGKPVAVESCYEVRPGDNRRYDRIFGKGTGLK